MGVHQFKTPPPTGELYISVSNNLCLCTAPVTSVMSWSFLGSSASNPSASNQAAGMPLTLPTGVEKAKDCSIMINCRLPKDNNDGLYFQTIGSSGFTWTKPIKILFHRLLTLPWLLNWSQWRKSNIFQRGQSHFSWFLTWCEMLFLGRKFLVW